MLTSTDDGPLTRRFCLAFFPEIENHTNNFQSMAITLYRELSETIHGNMPCYIPLPESFEFNETAFGVWHEKAATTRFIVHFCLCTRYLRFVPEDRLSDLEAAILEQLGHIEPIREIFGGPSTT